MILAVLEVARICCPAAVITSSQPAFGGFFKRIPNIDDSTLWARTSNNNEEQRRGTSQRPSQQA